MWLVRYHINWYDVVRSLLSETCDVDAEPIGFKDETYDVEVDHMVALIGEDYPFEQNNWNGGVKACDVAVK